MRDLVERKQKSGESIESFYFTMYKLRSNMRESMSDRVLVKIIKINLKDNLAHVIYPMTVYSVDHLRDECIEAETYFSRRDTQRNYVQPQRYQQQSKGHNISEVTMTNDENAEQ